SAGAVKCSGCFAYALVTGIVRDWRSFAPSPQTSATLILTPGVPRSQTRPVYRLPFTSARPDCRMPCGVVASRVMRGLWSPTKGFSLSMTTASLPPRLRRWLLRRNGEIELAVIEHFGPQRPVHGLANVFNEHAEHIIRYGIRRMCGID